MTFMHCITHNSPTISGTVPGIRPAYDPTTLAMDALAAAGHIVRGFDLNSFDPVRAALAAEHAPLVRGANADVKIISSRIAAVLEQTTRRAEAKVHAEQMAMADL
jgi:hypothetical protein